MVAEKPETLKSQPLNPYSKQHIFPEEYAEEYAKDHFLPPPETKENHQFDFTEMVRKLITQKTYPIRGISPDFNPAKASFYKIERHGSGGLGANLVNDQGETVAVMPFWTEEYSDQEKYIIKPDGPYDVHYDQSGREVMRLLRQEGGAGVVPDPEPADVVSSDAARAWLERQLRSYEGLGSEIDMSIVSSLLSTISGRIPDALGVKRELLIRTRARIFYHNAAIRARFRLGDLMEVFGQLQLPEHQEILGTPGVRESIVALINNDGEFFRLGGAAADAERTNIKNNLQVGLGLAPDRAILALELAEKFAQMTGEASYYDGIRDLTGNWQHFEVGATGETDYQAYADYLAEHWDDIDQANSLQGQGSANMRRAFFYPVFLQKPATDNRGRAEYLRRYAYLWVNSAVHFRNPAFNAEMNLLDFADHIDSQWIKWIVWAGKVSKAHGNAGQLNEKGAESILNVPLIEPNNLKQDTSEQTINGVMDNYKKAIAVFGHLNYPEEVQRSMTHLLRGVMEYVSERHINQARAEGFITWLGINQDQVFSVLRWAAKIGAVTYVQAEGLRHQLDLTLFRVAAEAAAPHLGQGIWAGIRGFWGAITGK